MVKNKKRDFLFCILVNCHWLSMKTFRFCSTYKNRHVRCRGIFVMASILTAQWPMSTLCPPLLSIVSKKRTFRSPGLRIRLRYCYSFTRPKCPRVTFISQIAYAATNYTNIRVIRSRPGRLELIECSLSYADQLSLISKWRLFTNKLTKKGVSEWA